MEQLEIDIYVSCLKKRRQKKRNPLQRQEWKYCINSPGSSFVSDDLLQRSGGAFNYYICRPKHPFPTLLKFCLFVYLTIVSLYLCIYLYLCIFVCLLTYHICCSNNPHWQQFFHLCNKLSWGRGWSWVGRDVIMKTAGFVQNRSWLQ